MQFESFVNSEECKTFRIQHPHKVGLRTLLIQKSVKLTHFASHGTGRLRALLIQKSVKQNVH